MQPDHVSPSPTRAPRVPFFAALAVVAFFAPFLASALAYALAPQGTVRFHALQALVYAAGITLLWGAYPAEPAWLQRLQARFGRWPLAITAGVMGGSLAVLGGLAIRHW